MGARARPALSEVLCDRQASFLWQVSGPRFSDPFFLHEGVLNYARLLKLMQLNPTAFLVPTYQIDLMWHTHMLASFAVYHRDAGALIGRRAGPDHDDSVNDRSHVATKLNTCTATTKELWKRAFGRDYFCPGGMFRGEPPPEYWLRGWHPSSELSGADAAAIKPANVVNQQPLSAKSLLFEALSSGADVRGVEDSRLTTKAFDALVGGAPPDGAITDTTVAEVKTPSLQASSSSNTVPVMSLDSNSMLAQGTVVKIDGGYEEQIYGCDPVWLKSIPSFIPAAPKSTTRENANPQLKGYVFGVGIDESVGYWRLDTPLADAIIVRKLAGRLRVLEKIDPERERTLDYVRAEVRFFTL